MGRETRDEALPFQAVQEMGEKGGGLIARALGLKKVS